MTMKFTLVQACWNENRKRIEFARKTSLLDLFPMQTLLVLGSRFYLFFMKELHLLFSCYLLPVLYVRKE